MEDKHIAPVPDLFKLVTKGVGDNLQFSNSRKQVRPAFYCLNLGLQLLDGGFEIVEALERMATAEIGAVEGLLTGLTGLSFMYLVVNIILVRAMSAYRFFRCTSGELAG